MFGCFWNQLTVVTLPFAVLYLTFVITMLSKTSPIPQCPAMSDVPDSSFDTFAHMVETGWSTECADLSGIRPNHSSGIYSLDTSGSGDLTGFLEDVTACGSEFSGDDIPGTKGFDMACGPDLPAESCDYEASDISWRHAPFFDNQVANDPVVSNIDACIDAAYSMIPVDPPKPIWEQGVWADIFGDGVFLKSGWTSIGLKKFPLPCATSSWDAATSSNTRRAKSLKVSAGNFTHEDIVINKTDQTWQEERESLLQSGLKRWLVASSYFNARTVIRTQLDCELTELGKLTLLADIFRGRALATLLKRVRSVEKMCSHFGFGNFPPDEPSVYQFFTAERKQGAPPSRSKGFLEALSFCRHVLSMDQLGQVIQSRRCLGATTADVPSVISQASPLKVDELKMLHTKLLTGETRDRIFSGAILFAVYSRARWSDLMHCTEVLLDRDDHNVLRFMEGHTASHKTMRAEMFKHRFLPLTAPAFGVSSDCWPEHWMASRHSAGVMLPPFHTIMPAPDSDGCPTQRPLTSNEASQWLRKLLTGDKRVDGSRKISVHSCKVTCLSFCAKYGIDPMARLQLGYHAGGGTGLKMVHTYSRDASSEPLAKLVKVLEDIRVGRFLPDSTRSGRFVYQGMATTDGSVKPMPSGREELSAVESVDLVSEKSESESDQEVGTSSSDSSSQEEFQEEQKKLKVYYPPEPPVGYVFWQHSRLKTLHLAPPDFKRVFMCNRMVGPFHTKSNMSIRYDTPVCRLCVGATKPKGEAGVD